MLRWLILIAFGLFGLLFPPHAACGQTVVHTEANVPAEVAIQSAAAHADPFNQIDVDVVFTRPGGGGEARVPAFWAGGKTWKVRYASPVVGWHTFRTVSSDATDAGLHNVTGAVEVAPYTGDNALYRHGPVRVSADRSHFEHADGTAFLWLGDTWWMGLSARLSFPDEFAKLTADRRAKGFNVVQIVAGLYPDMPSFDERGANEAGQPWEKDYARIRPEYFDAADRRIRYLADQGIVPCVVGAWGYHLPWLGAERMRRHQRYVYARWGALPIVWCVAGETNLPYYLDPDFPEKGGPKLAADWAEVIRYCRSINAFARPITAHPTGIPPRSMRGVLGDGAQKLLDFDMLQTPHGQFEVLRPTVEAAQFSRRQRPAMPTVNGEPSYEMLMDRTPAAVARMAFWVSWASGVKGYTYGANGIWQLNRKDKPYGNSPHGGTYGKIPWDEAMHLPGSTQVAEATKLIASLPWTQFEPRPQWARWAGDATAPAVTAAAPGDWIWSEGDAATDAPAEPRFFRRVFDLPEDARVRSASLRIAADDQCTVWLNGTEIGSNDDWHILRSLDSSAVSRALRPGRNVLAVRAENVKSKVTKNPAGLVAGLQVDLEDGQSVSVRTDDQWRAVAGAPADWEKPAFDDGQWARARVVATYGGGPWGRHDEKAGEQNERFVVPYAFGAPGVARLVYVPSAKDAVVVSDLEPDVRYRATHFDPETARRTNLGDVTPDATGTWRCNIPAGVTHDWVIVLEGRQPSGDVRP